MTHYEQGVAHYQAKRYEAALDAFDEALEAGEESAELWRDAGRAHAQLEDWEAADEAYERAIELNESDPLTWYGKGNVFQATGDADMALKAYETALLFDANWALPWLAKGAILLSTAGRGEEGLRCLRRAEQLDGPEMAVHCFQLFAQLPPFPFFSYRIVRDYMLPWQYADWKDYAEQSLSNAQPLRTYLSWYQQQTQASPFVAGLAHYLMGDPAPALRHFKESETGDKLQNTLQLTYYQVQACWAFAEPDDQYLDRALQAAAHFLPAEKGGWQLWKKKKKQPDAPPLPPEEWEACYYAGMVFIENDELDKALRCFERIEQDYLPALYMGLWVCEEKVNTKKKNQKAEAILQREAEQPSFIESAPQAELTLDPHRFAQQIQAAMRYEELSEALELLHFYADFEGKEAEVLLPRQEPAIHQRWSMSPAVRQEIEQLQRQQLRAALEEQLPENNPLTEISRMEQAEERFEQLGQWLEGNEFDSEQALRLITALHLQAPLREEHKLMLDLYAFAKNGQVEHLPDALFKGAPLGNGAGVGRPLGEQWGLSGNAAVELSEKAQKAWDYLQEAEHATEAFADFRSGIEESWE